MDLYQTLGRDKPQKRTQGPRSLFECHGGAWDPQQEQPDPHKFRGHISPPAFLSAYKSEEHKNEDATIIYEPFNTSTPNLMEIPLRGQLKPKLRSRRQVHITACKSF